MAPKGAIAPLARRIEGAALTVGAVLGVLCLLAAAAALVFGIKPLVFSSGSMVPAIPTGSLGIAIPVDPGSVKPGDVISVENSQGVRITHRVVSVSPSAAGPGFVLRGDANATDDLQTYHPAAVDRLLFAVPGLGTVLGWLGSPAAIFAGGLLCAWLLYVAFGRGPGRGAGDDAEGGPKGGGAGGGADSGLPRAARRGRRAAAMVLVAGLGLPLAAGGRTEPTWATFTSSAAATASPRALAASKPQNVACASSTTTSVNISWTVPSPQPTGYLLTAIANNGGTPAVESGQPSIDQSLANNGAASSYIVSIGSSQGLIGQLLNLLLGYDNWYTVRLYANYGLWQSQPVGFTKVHATAGLLGSNPKLTCAAAPDIL